MMLSIYHSLLWYLVIELLGSVQSILSNDLVIVWFLPSSFVPYFCFALNFWLLWAQHCCHCSHYSGKKHDVWNTWVNFFLSLTKTHIFAANLIISWNLQLARRCTYDYRMLWFIVWMNNICATRFSYQKLESVEI